MTDKPKLPPGSPCTNCGKCCTKPSFMQGLGATGDDVKRWRREKRYDILRFAWVLGPPDDPYADLWIDERLEERERCPFVRKVRGENRYLCRIYETRPQVCRDYEPWAPGSTCEVLS
jgi:Fe-S-cluster containining protein